MNKRKKRKLDKEKKLERMVVVSPLAPVGA